MTVNLWIRRGASLWSMTESFGVDVVLAGLMFVMIGGAAALGGRDCRALHHNHVPSGT